ncbi:hypothetical protein DAPPUDRAFT_344917 [Daphnia pulex]|uniref:Uncharacterized protein n=1 Tax=Daphnia pulex TaxID=6669 RepID=E9I752_DAPPU|nr:hypothetical protein DAPPUDRAFT_344917 [Daphnia pulex]|eukprot:EFX60178.1 hypothetical protein DAPPUDRAFT_344917 [Daphnia pulex]
MDHYFDLSDQQYEYFSKKAKTHLNWFSEKQIPGIIGEIERIRASQTHLDPVYMKSLLDDRSRALWIAIADRLAADGAELFRQLTVEQFDHFEEMLDEDSEEFVKIVDLPPKKFKTAYLNLQEDIMDKMETWVGSLTKEQEARIIDIMAMKQEDYRREISILVEIKKEFLRQAKEKVKEGGVEEFLKAWARQPNISGDRYAMYQEWQVTRQLNLWIEMEKMVSEKQRKHREEKLAQLINDLKTIQATAF